MKCKLRNLLPLSKLGLAALTTGIAVGWLTWHSLPRQPRVILRPAGAKDVVRPIGFSGDGRMLATHDNATQGTIRLWDTSTGREQRNIAIPFAGMWNMRMSADAGTLAVLREAHHRNWNLELWDLSQGKRRLVFPLDDLNPRLLPSNPLPPGEIAISPDGRHLAHTYDLGVAITKSPTRITLWDTATGAQRIAQGYDGSAAILTFSSDGKYLAACCWGARGEQSCVYVFEVPTLHEKGKFVGLGGIRFSADGHQVAGPSFDAEQKKWSGRGYDMASGEVTRDTPLARSEEYSVLDCLPDENLAVELKWDRTRAEQPWLQTVGQWLKQPSWGVKRIWLDIKMTELSSGHVQEFHLPLDRRYSGNLNQSMLVDPAGRAIACSSDDSSIAIWDLPPKRPWGTIALLAIGASVAMYSCGWILRRLFKIDRTSASSLGGS